MRVFLVAGLGADERLFRNLDLSGFEVIPALWLKPEKADTLTTYATKLIREYGIRQGDAVIGVSLGGMLTVEIAKQVKLAHAIIISSIKSKAEAPWYFGFFRAFPIYRLFTGGFVKKLGPLLRPLFGVFAGSKEAPLFYSMLQNSDPDFLTWAMYAALGWNGDPAPYPIHQFIGSKDLIFNAKKAKSATVIPGADHMLVFTRAAEISPAIRKILNNETTA
ncbi:hypothetical protein BEL04_05740 [Mucilaginibacter sp. PPCGB 2223]|uniref:alpha/beta hydrolase n=1 Tax=Mucilaginibacter sp. PPCGB 2223 TaxID=1886027 RepID=UPI000825A004|nr:alpha/beta hydrolase [Mucilaginibacter sp. PPCGB 2223]OCX53787.1 hypothetical protein BEL04_05740 [Mucilaginibacter sp. PPCGB 2223]